MPPQRSNNEEGWRDIPATGPADQWGHFIAQNEQMTAERISEPADAASGVHANGACWVLL